MENIKLFMLMELRDAYAYIAEHNTNVAIHLHWITTQRAPKCFVRDVRKGYPIAHVFCQDKQTLIELAKRHKIHKIFIDNEDEHGQHIDFCGKPLRTLLESIGESIEHYRKPVELKRRDDA